MLLLFKFRISFKDFSFLINLTYLIFIIFDFISIVIIKVFKTFTSIDFSSLN